MFFSGHFISRPVATTLLTLGMALAGVLAFFQLPVAALPQVDFPSISVRAALPGASAETMASSVAAPLERTLGRIAGISEMVSSSGFGVSEITLQFDLDRDFDGAARDVQAAINAANQLLPAMPSPPSYRRNNPSDTPLMILALTSEVLDRPQLFDVASTVIAQKLSQIEGIGLVSIRGSALPAVRIELNPAALAKYAVSFADVRAAITATNVNRPKGALDDGQRHWQVAVNDQAQTAADYAQLVIAYQNGAPIRLTDVGQVMDSAENLGNSGFLDGKPGVMLVLFKQDHGNVIEAVAKVKAALPQLQASLPPSVELTEAMDRSVYIRAALHEVELTLVIAVVLVIMVVFVFLRNLRSAMIPIITVPVSLVATFGLMHLGHFSLNLLTMMALTVATGFVVDDAIVVLENTNRHIEEGIPPKQAALLAINEVGFTLLTMSLSLVAVFIPILLMDGIVGRLFREFGLTLCAAVLVSLWVSFTTTPMLCAYWLRPHTQTSRKNGFYQASERGFQWLQAGYDHSLAWVLRHRRSVLVVLGLVVALNVHLYSLIPKGFFPDQDTGRLVGGIQGEQTISSQAMKTKLNQIIGIIRQDPNVASVVATTEGDRANNGRLFVMLKPLAERDLSASALMTQWRGPFANVPGVGVYLRPAQELRIGGRPSPATFQYALQADDLEELKIWTPQIVRALQQLPELTDVNTDQQDKGQQVSLQIDKAAAARLGVTPTLIDSTLNDAFGDRQVSVIYKPLNQYHVVMGAASEYAQNPQALDKVYVSVPPTATQPAGAKVPLAAVARYQLDNRALSVNHQDQFPTATISFNLTEGVSLSTASAAIHQALDNLGVPVSVRGSFQGSAKEFQKTLKNQPWLILTALVSIYIVLGILYESYVHPLTILSTLPSAGVGAILALWLFDTEFSIIALIGVILLIGIVKKNAIMMIDFAIATERNNGISAQEAIRQACHLRFRPIMMTTFGALLAAIPLAFGGGYGSELLQPLGIAIIGGLVTSQLLTLYSTPVIYLYLDRCQTWFQMHKSRKTNRLETL